MNYYPFYRHVIGQWHKVNFTVDGVIYNCPEQYMMAQKALLFNDVESFYKIMKSDSPREQQMFGRLVNNFDPYIWDRNKIGIVHKGNYHRFQQSTRCFQELIKTAPFELVEASPTDLVWGVGLETKDPRIQDPSQWRGQNLLGKILTIVRNELILEPGKTWKEKYV
jgi:ribA/ribD-fused uncharacterized protein